MKESGGCGRRVLSSEGDANKEPSAHFDYCACACVCVCVCARAREWLARGLLIFWFLVPVDTLGVILWLC